MEDYINNQRRDQQGHGQQHPGKPPNKKSTIVGLSILSAVVLVGVAVGVSLAVSGGETAIVSIPTPTVPAATSSAPSATPSPNGSSPVSSAGESSGDEMPVVQTLALGIMSNLNKYSADGVMKFVCADGKTHGAREDLITDAPYLTAPKPPPGSRLVWKSPEISPAEAGDGYQVILQGASPDGKTSGLVFRVYVHQRVANWCGVGRAQ